MLFNRTNNFSIINISLNFTNFNLFMPAIFFLLKIHLVFNYYYLNIDILLCMD